MSNEKVKIEIEIAAQNFLQSNPFINKARSGSLTRAQVTRYLKNILYSIEFTPIHLKAASLRAGELGLTEIAKFMNDKYIEEYGHDKWVRADLRKLGVPSELHNKKELTHGIIDLIKFVETLVYGNPLYYIAYITFAEYFTVLVAPELLDCIINKCGIPKSALTVVSNHGELDKKHVNDDFNTLKIFVDSPEKTKEFIQVIHKSAEIINQHFSECAEAA